MSHQRGTIKSMAQELDALSGLSISYQAVDRYSGVDFATPEANLFEVTDSPYLDSCGYEWPPTMRRLPVYYLHGPLDSRWSRQPEWSAFGAGPDTSFLEPKRAWHEHSAAGWSRVATMTHRLFKSLTYATFNWDATLEGQLGLVNGMATFSASWRNQWSGDASEGLLADLLRDCTSSDGIPVHGLADPYWPVRSTRLQSTRRSFTYIVCLQKVSLDRAEMHAALDAIGALDGRGSSADEAPPDDDSQGGTHSSEETACSWTPTERRAKNSPRETRAGPRPSGHRETADGEIAAGLWEADNPHPRVSRQEPAEHCSLGEAQ